MQLLFIGAGIFLVLVLALGSKSPDNKIDDKMRDPLEPPVRTVDTPADTYMQGRTIDSGNNIASVTYSSTQQHNEALLSVPQADSSHVSQPRSVDTSIQEAKTEHHFNPMQWAMTDGLSALTHDPMRDYLRRHKADTDARHAP